MKNILLALLLTFFPSDLPAGEAPEKVLKSYLAMKSERGSVFAQGTLDGVDYRKLLRGAVDKDPDSLAGIFRYTANGKLMGEGAESNCDILRQLLMHWGDKGYARVLAAEPARIRTAVIAGIDYAWPHPGWKPDQFPATHRLAKHWRPPVDDKGGKSGKSGGAAPVGNGSGKRAK